MERKLKRTNVILYRVIMIASYLVALLPIKKEAKYDLICSLMDCIDDKWRIKVKVLAK